jgi:hypothetical protein
MELTAQFEFVVGRIPQGPGSTHAPPIIISPDLHMTLLETLPPNRLLIGVPVATFIPP